jgi:hypothetical protein
VQELTGLMQSNLNRIYVSLTRTIAHLVSPVMIRASIAKARSHTTAHPHA